MSWWKTAGLIAMVVVIELCLMVWHLEAGDEADFDPYWDRADWKY